VLYRHPILDERLGITEASVLSDDEIDRLIEDFIYAARLAQKAGFDFVDIKHSHGYLGHEFLSAVDRNGRYGGSFENRTRFLREVVQGIRSKTPELGIGIRISAFDFAPFQRQADGAGKPSIVDGQRYEYAFGGDKSGTGIDLGEVHDLLLLLEIMKVQLVCVSAGSPYYSPPIQRPAYFPPSDGYAPPEDPLVGVARLINVTAELKKDHPSLTLVGSGYSYLQEWMPHVAHCVVRTGMADFVGIGRLALTYPDIVSDLQSGKPLNRKRLCRTFSDCTTAPRNGLVSGCYPLDEFYSNLQEANELLLKKRAISKK
jgi:2,4-dienoyl-CoA reductase-like NADH-dependent reductase (Old Yellow Enzyme family)